MPSAAAAGLALLAAALAAPAQTPAPRFDVASIRVSPRTERSTKFETPKGGYWSVRAMPVATLLVPAFLISPERTNGLPSWADSARYDIEARMPPATTTAQFRLMLQSLLADRFQMRWRIVQKPAQVSILTAGPPGPGLHPATGDCTGARVCGTVHIARLSKQNIEIAGNSVTMADLAAFFSAAAIHPVVDETRSTALFDFDINISTPASIRGEPRSTYDVASAKLLKKAFHDQLGLNLDYMKTVSRPMPFLVIEHLAPPSPN
ncbi:MAG: TIGR03435 family protein [Terriglobales bacterium]